MKLASLKHGRDGKLVVVSDDLAWCAEATGIAPTLQAALEHQAAQRPATPYVFGDAPSLADIVLVPQMANARRFKTDLAPFPHLVAWDENARKHPAFIKAAPENQKAAVKK